MPACRRRRSDPESASEHGLAVGTSNKRIWCVDSCYKQSVQCEKKCKTQTEFELDIGQCQLDCWSEFMLPCSENCMLKDTPFAAKP